MHAVGYKKGVKEDLVLWSIGSGHFLRADAAAYFLAMKQAAREAGLDLVVNSSFRSMEKQEALFTAYIKGVAAFEAKKRASRPSIVAKPGYSNHQSGVAVDINRAPGDDLSTLAPDSPLDKWLAANALEYGFQRTVASEPWHWEYNA